MNDKDEENDEGEDKDEDEDEDKDKKSQVSNWLAYAVQNVLNKTRRA